MAMNEGTLSPRNIEEPASRCNVCGSGLSIVEGLLYGNRCLFCTTEKKQIKILDFAQHCFLDFLIYNQVSSWHGLAEKCSDCKEGRVTQVIDDREENPVVDVSSCTSCNGSGAQSVGRLKMIGFLGSVGAAYYNELTIKQKWELLRGLK